MGTKKHVLLKVILGVPVLLVLIHFTFTPAMSLLVKPQYNFLYFFDTSAGGHRAKNTYWIENGHVVLMPLNERSGVTILAPDLYLYDVKTNSTHKVEFEDIKNTDIYPFSTSADSYAGINSYPTSPDGYSVHYEQNYDFFVPEKIISLFRIQTYDNGFFISKYNHMSKKKLTALPATLYGTTGRFVVLGWSK